MSRRNNLHLNQKFTADTGSQLSDVNPLLSKDYSMANNGQDSEFPIYNANDLQTLTEEYANQSQKKLQNYSHTPEKVKLKNVLQSQYVLQPRENGSIQEPNHYMNEKIEKTIQKFSKNQILINSKRKTGSFTGGTKSVPEAKSSTSPYTVVDKLGRPSYLSQNGNHERSFENQKQAYFHLQPSENLNNSFQYPSYQLVGQEMLNQGSRNPSLIPSYYSQGQINLGMKQLKQSDSQNMGAIAQANMHINNFLGGQNQQFIPQQVQSQQQMLNQIFVPSQMRAPNQKIISGELDQPLTDRDMIFTQAQMSRAQTLNTRHTAQPGQTRTNFLVETQNLMPKNIKNNPNMHPFGGPKLHLYKKGSRRIKTSSATRQLPYPVINHNNIYNNIEQVNIINQVAQPIPANNHSPYQGFEGLIYANQYQQQAASTIEAEPSRHGLVNEKSKHRPHTTNLDGNQQLNEDINLQSLESTPLDKADIMNTSTESTEAKLLYKHLNTDEKRASKQYLDGFIASFYNCQENMKIEEPSNQQDEKTSKGKPKQVLYFNGNVKPEKESIPGSSAQTPCFLHTPNNLNSQSPRHLFFSDKLAKKQKSELSNNLQVPIVQGINLNIQQRNKSEEKTSKQIKFTKPLLNKRIKEEEYESEQHSPVATDIKGKSMLNGDESKIVVNKNVISLKTDISSRQGYRRPLSRNHPIFSKTGAKSGTRQTGIKKRQGDISF